MRVRERGGASPPPRVGGLGRIVNWHCGGRGGGLAAPEKYAHRFLEDIRASAAGSRGGADADAAGAAVSLDHEGLGPCDDS